MHKIHTKRALSYFIDRVNATAELRSSAGLRSASTSKYQTPTPRIRFGERVFSYAGPSAWNTHPDHVQTPPHSTDILRLFFFDERLRTFCSFVIIQIHFGF